MKSLAKTINILEKPVLEKLDIFITKTRGLYPPDFLISKK